MSGEGSDKRIRRRSAAERRQRRAEGEAAKEIAGVGGEYYAIAVLSLIGSLIWWSQPPSLEGGFLFFMALAFTFFIDAIATGLTLEMEHGAPMIVAGVVNAGAIFTFAVIGFFTQRRSRIAFWLGIFLYGCDTLLAGVIMLIGEPVGFIMVGFHCFILIRLVKRWRAGWAAAPQVAAAVPATAGLDEPVNQSPLAELQRQAEGVFDIDPRSRARERARQRRKRRE
ncbi:MAG: hypothetical protein ACYTGX_09750 [Planctomycetota bacterium]|jgi:hypothetical protein